MRSFLKKYINKFRHAFSGLWDGICHDRSILLQISIGMLVICVCLCLSLSLVEWLAVLAMILLVLSAEFINSALEELCDSCYPQYDVRAKKIKDYSAAAVLLISVLAALVGIYVIGGKLL